MLRVCKKTPGVPCRAGCGFRACVEDPADATGEFMVQGTYIVEGGGLQDARAKALRSMIRGMLEQVTDDILAHPIPRDKENP